MQKMSAAAFVLIGNYDGDWWHDFSSSIWGFIKLS
jgi:hypothetical protein